MVRIRPLTKDEVSPEVREYLEAGERWLGETPHSTGIQARTPIILEASRALSAAPGRSGLLSEELRSLVCLRAALMVGCPF